MREPFIPAVKEKVLLILAQLEGQTGKRNIPIRPQYLVAQIFLNRIIPRNALLQHLFRC